MSIEPGGRPVSAVEQARSDARRQARTFSSAFVLFAGIALAVTLVGVFVVLDYVMEQDPHRLVKITLGAALLATIVMMPHIGLFTVPVLAPFIEWLPKLPIPGINTLNILVVSLFMSYAVPLVLQRRPVFRSGPVGWRLLTILGLAGLSIVRGAAYPTGYGYNAVAATLELFRTALIFSLYFIALAMIRNERDRHILAWAVVIGLLAESLITIKMGRNFRGRASGSINQPNDLGAFLSMFTAFAAALVFGAKRWWARVIAALSVIGGCVGVVLSVSRGGLLALAVGLGFVALRSSRVLVILLAVATLTGPLWAPDFLKERITGTVISDENGDEAELESSSADRVATWKTIGDLMTDHPIEGVGFCGLEAVLSMISVTQSLDIKDSAHNTYLRFLGEMGIFGLALFLWTLWTCWSTSVAGMRAARTRFDRQVALGYGGATIGLAISCMFGDRFFPITLGANFWILSAVVTDIIDQSKRGPA